MFGKMFEAIAKKQLQENAIDRLTRKLNHRHYEKIGTIVKFPNGTEGIDMVKVGASNLKRNVLYYTAVLGLAIAAGKLGGRNY